MKNVLLLIAISVLNISAQQIPTKIENTYVQDFADVLSLQDEEVIQSKLTSIKAKHNIEIGVATVKTTNNIDIFWYSLQMARKYGIGSRDGEKRGILLLLATEDRKYFTQISRHMESYLTDGQAGSLQRRHLVPKLKIASTTKKSSDWRDAIMNTVVAYEAAIDKTITPVPLTTQDKSNNSPEWVWTFIGVLGLVFAVLVPLSVFTTRRNRRREQRLAEARYKTSQELREAWLKTPAGIKFTEMQTKRSNERARSELLHQQWLRTKEGREWKAKKDKEEKEEKERLAAIRKESERIRLSYSYDSSQNQTSDDSDTSFGGGGDFGGGGAGGSW